MNAPVKPDADEALLAELIAERNDIAADIARMEHTACTECGGNGWYEGNAPWWAGKTPCISPDGEEFCDCLAGGELYSRLDLEALQGAREDGHG